MPGSLFHRRTVTCCALSLICILSPVVAGAADSVPSLSSNFRIISARGYAAPAAVKPGAHDARSAAPLGVATPFPRPPLSGFTPWIAITTSDSHKTGDLEWEHVLRSTYTGTNLNPPADANYVIGIFDSGSTADVIGYCSTQTLGLTPDRMTGNTVELSGAGGEPLFADVSDALGLFGHSLAAIDANGLLDLTTIKGHTNVSMVVLPPETCGDGIELPPFMGMPFLSFFTTVVRNDLPQQVTLEVEDDFGTHPVTYKGPDVQIKEPGDPTIPAYPRKIAMNYSPAIAGTSAFFGDFEDFRTPVTPTQIADSASLFPIGGAFFSTMGALEGDPGPTNPIQNMRVILDTGAQACIMTPAMAANLSMPVEPDFEIEILGVGGTSTAPGYYVDYVRINALGGVLEFSQVPFVVLDLPSPDGGQVDGIMGMNLFWNRNVIFEGVLGGSGFFHVSDLIPFAYGDFDRDFDVDTEDLDFFKLCATRSGVEQVNPECTHVDLDLDTDIDLEDYAVFQRCYSGADNAALANCGY